MQYVEKCGDVMKVDWQICPACSQRWHMKPSLERMMEGMQELITISEQYERFEIDPSLAMNILGRLAIKMKDIVRHVQSLPSEEVENKSLDSESIICDNSFNQETTNEEEIVNQ